MISSIRKSGVVTALVLSIGALPAFSSIAIAGEPASAITAMLELGPEGQRLAARAGTWDARITIRPSPDAAPLVWNGLTAERRMIGGFLQEVLSKTGPDAFQRIAYLHYNRVEGRWQYVSMDTRFPAGIMPAWSEDAGRPDHISLQFEPIAFPGWGAGVDGWMLRSTYEVSGIGTDHETAHQYWTRADGTGQRWLAVEYDYRRRR